MRKIIWLLVLTPMMALAQTNSGVSHDMQKMMEQAMKAQACMQGIDTSQIEDMEAQGKKMEAEIKALCDAGKRDEAQETAIAYSRELMEEPVMEKVRECSEHLRGLIPKMPFDNFEEEFENRHICDEMK